MAHIASAAYAAAPNYYLSQAQPQQQQALQLQQQQHLQQQQSRMPIASNAHYTLGHHQPGQPQQPPQQQQPSMHPYQMQPSSQQASPHQSPFRNQLQQQQPHNMSPHMHLLMQQQGQQQQGHTQAPQVHPTRPLSNFKRELFGPSEGSQQQQSHAQAHLQQRHASLFGGKDLHASPPPSSDEYSQHEQNVRLLTDTPSPPPPPSAHVASMLSQILAPEIASKFNTQQPQQHMQHAGMPQQGSQPLSLQQAQLYAHFQQGGFGAGGGAHAPPQSYGHSQIKPQVQQQHAYTSPAAAIQLSQQQAHSMAQNSHFMRPPVQPSQQGGINGNAPPPSSYYDQPPSQPHASVYGTPQHQHAQQAPQQQHSLHNSPFAPLPQQQQRGAPPSPSHIPGMASIVDPDYLRLLARQREMLDLQQAESKRTQQLHEQHEQMMRAQQQQQQQQQRQAPLPQAQIQQHSASPYDAYAHPPPPLQQRAQSLPGADQSRHSFASFDPQQQQQHQQLVQPQEYLRDMASPPHSAGAYGMSSLQPLSQPAQQSHPQQQQQQVGPYASPSPLASPPGLVAPALVGGGGYRSDGASPAVSSQSQPQQQQQQSQSQQGQGQRRTGYSEFDFRSSNGAASPNVPSGSNGAVTPASAQGPSQAARMTNAPFPRRSTSLGESYGSGGSSAAPVSHEAVPISLGGGRRGAAGGISDGERAAAAANLSRFSAGPPNAESRGFVARCCTEARRGRASHTSPASASSVLSRASFGTRALGPREAAAPPPPLAGPAPSYVPLTMHNPFAGLSSSPDLPESASPAPSPSPTAAGSSSGSAQWGAQSASSTPAQSPKQAAPRARMHAPLVPPTQR